MRDEGCVIRQKSGACSTGRSLFNSEAFNSTAFNYLNPLICVKSCKSMVSIIRVICVTRVLSIMLTAARSPCCPQITGLLELIMASRLDGFETILSSMNSEGGNSASICGKALHNLPDYPAGCHHTHDCRHIADGANGLALSAPLDNQLIVALYFGIGN